VSIPSAVTGAGNGSQARNVFRLTFSTALSSIPTLESWDDSTFSSTSKEVFTGTPVNENIPYQSAAATTDAAPSSANWKLAAPVAGGATINRLMGTTYFVNLSVGVPGAGASVRFNLNWEEPSDAAVPATNTQNSVLACRYAYSGVAPTLSWAFNDNSAGGTEGAPIFTSITPGSAGNFVRPTDASATSANLTLTKPASGVADQGAIWVTNT
jgi:hypothetical protein